MPKTKLDIGATVDFLNKDELSDALARDRERAQTIEHERLAGIKYMRGPRIQGTVYNGTIGGVSVGTGTNTFIGGPPFGPLSGFSWSIRRVGIGGLSNVNGSLPDTVGIYRNNVNSPPLAVVNANQPQITFPTLACVLMPGDSVVIGHVPNQASGNTYGTLTGTYLSVDFDIIEAPTQLLGKLA